MNANWNYPTAIRAGAGRIRELPDVCRDHHIKAPLLVTDPGLVSLPMVQDVIKTCEQSGLAIGVFSDIKGNPTGKNIEDGIAVYRAGKHDGVIAFGGGSGLDAGKAVAVAANQKCSMWDLEDVGNNWLNADSDKIPPILGIPTTAGTGSEVGRASVIVHEEQHRKVIIFHPKMLPVSVILDPELSVGLPAMLTAATGMDALSHNLEAYCAPGFHPLAAGIAVEGMRLIKENLPEAVTNGSNIEARMQMLVASSMGATAFQRGLGAMHALSHPLGAVYDAHHGTLNAILMPYVLKANYTAIKDLIPRLSNYLGLTPSFDAFLQWVLELRKEINIPDDLSMIIDDDQRYDDIGKMAVEDPSASTNPIQFSATEYTQIVTKAFRGEL